MAPLFLDLWEVVRIHQDQIERYQPVEKCGSAALWGP